MSELVPKMNDAVARPGGSQVSYRTRKAVRRSGEQALVAAAELMATEYVTSVAMDTTRRTVADEIDAASAFPDYAYRFRRIGEAQAMAAARTVEDFGR